MKIVFTNGVFDILHPGHLKLLEKARSLGDFLVVGIDSDKRVGMIKPGRPVNNQKFRKEMLMAIKWVDDVIIFNDLEKLITNLIPDIIVKGGDYKKRDIVGGNIVESYGGEIVIIPLKKDYSTTNLIKKIHGFK